MNVTFCARCGLELDYYEGWRVSLHFDNDPRPPIEARQSGLICGDCAAPAIAVVADVISGEYRFPRFKSEIAA